MPRVTTKITIISGGQTGVDRAALDAALDAGVDCGGWCPADRSAEDGVIPPRYPVTPLPNGTTRDRTRRNVEDSDATNIISDGEPTGGTLDTLNDCRELNKPHLLLDSFQLTIDQAATRLLDFIRQHTIHRLNIAGPRASESASAGPFAYRLIQGYTEIVSREGT